MKKIWPILGDRLSNPTSIPAPEPKKGPEEEKKRAAPTKDDDFPSDPDLFRERDEDEEAPQ
jgi:hypothetical protein